MHSVDGEDQEREPGSPLTLDQIKSLPDDLLGYSFYVRSPEPIRNTPQAMRHADQLVQTVGAVFVAPDGIPVQEPDGTYEVRILAGDSMSRHIVAGMLIEHRGLEVLRAEPFSQKG
ncbi:MAG TPA: hypothetical protein VIF43_01700 [Patescibacteria group bacterium]|jgi:hypothetical protein